MQTIATTIQQLTHDFAHASTTPRLDAELLIAHLLKTTRTRLILLHHDPFPPLHESALADLRQRRLAGEPIAYLTNTREFYGLDFYVDSRVLVPRPESELLVELALAAAHRLNATTVADICTGSGCIALAIAHTNPHLTVIAADISPDALAVAQINRENLTLTPHVHLVQADLCAPMMPIPVIVSNPPYTILSDIDANVRDFEPHLALAGGDDDGASFYRTFAQLLPHHLARPGFFACEIDHRQADIVAQILQSTFPDGIVTRHCDLAGLVRVIALDIPSHSI
ncbi:MAG: peptide chain release factor N(5)-glutamine methyltransferase [Roseiflexaceae bacterium]